MCGDPEVQSLLAHLAASGRPSSLTLPLEEGRRNFTDLMVSLAEPEPAGETTETQVPGPAGPIPVRVYRPAPSEQGTPPLVAFFHGGGWVFGGLDSHDPMCRGLLRHSGAVVVAVDYRRPPEAPFPAAFEDCLAVVEYLRDHGGALGGDPERMAVAGDSSGGNLAAAVSLSLRGTASPLRLQLLFYPALDPRMSSPSYHEHADDPFLSRAEMEQYWPRYLGGSVGAPSPFAAPALADDLAGVAPAHITVAGQDPLRDDGLAYRHQLAAAGVPVELVRHDEMVHGFLSFTKWLNAGRQGIVDAGRALRSALDARGGDPAHDEARQEEGGQEEGGDEDGGHEEGAQ